MLGSLIATAATSRETGQHDSQLRVRPVGLTTGFGVAGVILAVIALPADIRVRLGPWTWATLVALSLALAVLAGAIAGPTAPGAHTAVMVPVLLFVGAGDVAVRRISNRSVLIALAAAIPASNWTPTGSVAEGLLGGLLGLGLGTVAFVGGRGVAFGAGDAKLAGLLGVVVGSVRGTLAALLYGSLAGGVAAAALLIARRRNAAFAYGPFLVLGAIVTLFQSL